VHLVGLELNIYLEIVGAVTETGLRRIRFVVTIGVMCGAVRALFEELIELVEHSGAL
jgi:hypothetical protein